MPKRCAVFPLIELFSLTWLGWLQLTHIIAEKEKKSSNYKDNKLDVLSDEKKAKIKKFAREYIHKILHRLEKGKRRPPDSGSGASVQSRHHDGNTTTPPLPPLQPLSTPSQQGEEGGDADMDMEMAMSVEEAMDLSADEDDPNGVDMDADEDDEDEPTPVEPAESDTSTTVASVPTPSSATAPADPRLRVRPTATAASASFAAASVEAKEKGWEMLGLTFESSTTAAS
jgi:histone-lysine N-methyltransferase SETD2